MFGASKTASVSGVASDPYYEYVTMLLTGDGTNGAQNNTFVDSSTNNFTITRNGNTTQGSFSPYGSLWSNYFGTSTDRIVTGSSSSFNLSTSDFCYEGWIYANNAGAVPYPRAFGLGPYYNDVNSFGVCIADSDVSDYITVYFNNGTLGRKLISTTTFINNQWNHIAVCRNGSNFALFFNGTRIATYVSSEAIGSGNRIAYIGSTDLNNEGFVGYASNVRFVKGSSVYDPTASTITVPTTPLTAITNTQLLTCQSNRFIDNSANAFSLTTNSTSSIQRFSPFNPTVPYSTATIGGSGYFDGTGDYLNTPATSALEFGSGDFTLECWVYPTTSARMALYHGSSGTDWSIGVDFQSQKFCIWASSNGSSWNLINADGGGNGVGTITVPLNAWTHFAYVRSGTTWQTYINGVRDLNLTGISGSLVDRSSSAKSIGKWWFSDGIGDPGPWTGEIANFRIVKGTAVYTSAFTPPTSPLTAITNTALLLNMTNAGIPDSAMMNDLETAGNAQVSTSVKKYGTGSIYKTNATDANYLVTQNISTLKFAGDFTIEMWLYPLSWDDATLITFASGTGRFQMGCDGSNFGLAASGVAWYLSYGTKPSLNTWTHIAITRSGSTLRMFYDGVQVQSATTSYSFTGFTHIGGYPGAGTNYTYNGYMDDLRITNGYARYTANFTPPTTALPTY